MTRHPRRNNSAITATNLTILVLATGLFFTVSARCQQPLTNNEFNIDAVTGPVLGSNRIVGMGGAFTALATSIDGVAWNPASYGSRTLWEPNWFEWDVAAGVMMPGTFSRNDFFNNGKGEGIGVSDFLFFDTGLRLQFAYLGVGSLYRSRTFTVELMNEPVNVNTWTIQYGGAWMLFDGELIVGLGARTLGMSMTLPETNGRTLVRFKGTGLEVGMVWRPEKWPFRVGASARAPVSSRQVAKDGQKITDSPDQLPADQVLGFILPQRVHIPWEAQLGFAVQLGERPMNLRWHAPTNPKNRLRPAMRAIWCEREASQARAEAIESGLEKNVVGQCPRLSLRPRNRRWWIEENQRRQEEETKLGKRADKEREVLKRSLRREYEELPRHYGLISLDLMVVGPTANGIGIDAFLDQELRRSGENPSFSVRLGGEVEPLANRLKLRAGGYLEPGRNSGVKPRIHGTTGFDVRLFTWDLFGWVSPFSIRAGGMVDLASRYFNWGVGIGMWH